MGPTQAQAELRLYDTGTARPCGKDGLDYYRFIISAARNYLNEDGYLMLEIGISQADAVMGMAGDTGLKNIILIKDYAGIDRIFIAKNNILTKK